MPLPTIRTVPCSKGGYCEFTLAGPDDMLCSKCHGLARHALEQGADPESEGPSSFPPGPSRFQKD